MIPMRIMLTEVEMKIAPLLLLLVIATGCTKQREPSSAQAPTPAAAPEPSGNHVLMPVSDMTKELMQHCSAAEKAFTDANTYLAENENDPSPRKIRKAREALKAAGEDMRMCKEMAHGVYEKNLGEPPAQQGGRSTK